MISESASQRFDGQHYARNPQSIIGDNRSHLGDDVSSNQASQLNIEN